MKEQELNLKLDKLFKEWYWSMMADDVWIANQINDEANQLIEELAAAE
jgi:hypothetical protein